METTAYTFDFPAACDALHRGLPARADAPVIGLTGNFQDGACLLLEGYFASVLAAGGLPLIIPPAGEPACLPAVLDAVDGLLLTGGADLNPLFLGEEPVPELRGVNPRRDLRELLLARLAADRQMPLFGICRGIQVMTAALGGTLYQDIRAQRDAPCLKHSQDMPRGVASHTVRLADGSLLRRLFGAGTLAVNSFHHQAVRDAAPGFRVTARSADGVVEAVESAEHKPMLGVQWHPECFLAEGDGSMMPLFRWFVAEAAAFRRAKETHRRLVTLDSHCDTPMRFAGGYRFDVRDKEARVDLHKMTEGRLDAVIMAAYLPQGERTAEALCAATAEADRLLDDIGRMVAANAGRAGLARTSDDVRRLKREGRKAVLTAVENGYAIGRDLANVERFRRRGVVYMTLCHNGNNDLCGSAVDNPDCLGVSDFGAQAIREMNRVGMLVDVSHAGERTFYDALDLSRAPIVASHSSARALCDHPRNLTDDQLRALAARGGVAQVCLYDGFLRRGGGASVTDAVAHIRHMVDVMGIEHVGIGSDFDGGGGIPGCASAAELINLTRLLLAEGYGEDDLRLLWGGNFLRVMDEASRLAALQS